MKKTLLAGVALAVTMACTPIMGATALARDYVIHAGHLIDGVNAGERSNVSILVHDDQITAVQDGFVTPAGAEVVDLSQGTVMPGLIDAHVHLTLDLTKGNALLQSVTHSAFDETLDGVGNARLTLLAGFTSVRDVGGDTAVVVALKRAQKAGTIPGPRMWVSGSILSPTGGHGDPANGFDPALAKPEWQDGIVDGPDEAMKKVREHFREGVDLIKIVPSGGVASVGDDPQAQLMTDAEIRAVVETAHTLHLPVAAHAHGAQAIDHASAIGVDSIEHGSFATPASYAIMKQHGTYLVPTLIAGATVVEFAQKHPELLGPSMAEKALAVGPIMAKNLYGAWKAGVKIAFGTDAGVYHHGQNAREFELMVKAGMPAADALRSSFTGAATLIGESRIGAIRPGAFADIVATDKDPLADITELQRVRFVMQGGRIVKDHGEPRI
ncbi:MULTISPECIES: amidohydrolase family protein [unclassified Novosphingobium]|uniref:metal-dependent hydrolase family protein n=1 Tax=unclassified Novosphingobium TaxID=2644732 RepID=UPI0017F48681|nr:MULTISPECIES: amidohydrolase family protein [unclassified Novosphingobium]NMN05082.1 imidazolonepropionase-like amidohydrolase [Novosphingobium sp. SG919]NMN87377.1 imidazolonepropionase-like amidohydrolase [Novosphingobium sp. SG916]